MGDAYPRLNLIGRELSLAPQLWRVFRRCRRPRTNRDDHRAADGDGALASPSLQLQLQQGGNPFLERWDLKGLVRHRPAGA